jgi:hypothetical protein
MLTEAGIPVGREAAVCITVLSPIEDPFPILRFKNVISVT